MSSDGPPSADNILNKPGVEGGTLSNVVGRGIRGAAYGIFLFIVSIATGIVGVVQELFQAVIDGINTVYTEFFGGVGLLIEQGAIRTTNSFLLPAPFGWLEGLAWVIVGVYLIRFAMSYFSTDIFFLPGFDVIPAVGNEQDGEDDGGDG